MGEMSAWIATATVSRSTATLLNVACALSWTIIRNELVRFVESKLLRSVTEPHSNLAISTMLTEADELAVFAKRSTWAIRTADSPAMAEKIAGTAARLGPGIDFAPESVLIDSGCYGRRAMQLFHRCWDLDAALLVGQSMDQESIRDHAAVELGEDYERARSLWETGAITAAELAIIERLCEQRNRLNWGPYAAA